MHYHQRMHSRSISRVRTRYKDCPKAQGEHKRRSGLLAEQSCAVRSFPRTHLKRTHTDSRVNSARILNWALLLQCTYTRKYTLFFTLILKVQTKMKPFKCIKQLILHSGIYVLLFFHILITNCMSHPWVCNVREPVWGDFENQNQTDRAIKL